MEINRKENSLIREKPMSESGRQFAEIYKQYSDTERRESKKFIGNRKKRIENLKKDLGI